MKHHLIDFLDREYGHWAMVPNRDRYIYELGKIACDNSEVRVATIGGNTKNWERIFALSKLQELTLHEPSNDQILELSRLKSITRLRITHARVNDIKFIGEMHNLEEVVLEYVSGFSDLSPLRSVNSLRAFHSECLRAVKDFSGISGLSGLKYLGIFGTVDFKQPVESFEFMATLKGLEALHLFQVVNQKPFPALLPIARMQNLRRLNIPRDAFRVEEYALLEVALPNTVGAAWEPCKRRADSKVPYPRDEVLAFLPESVLAELNQKEIFTSPDGQKWINDPKTEWFEFLGKGSGKVKCSSKQSGAKCTEFTESYEALKRQAAVTLASHLTTR